MKTVYDQYQVNPEEIEYIVTHGTGTKLGDPVEINALYDAFKDYTKKQGYCALTSTKTNFGHTFGGFRIGQSDQPGPGDYGMRPFRPVCIVNKRMTISIGKKVLFMSIKRINPGLTE